MVGVRATMDRYGWTREDIMAFGDGENDAEMLKLAGIGVAMGNAMDSVKAIADHVTDSADDVGVSAALRHLGLL